MIDLDNASKDIAGVIEKHFSRLEQKYSSVEHHGASIKCFVENRDCIELRAIPDYSRNNLKLPENGLDYQVQGGHKNLIEKLNSFNEKAWKIEVKKTSSGSTFEIAFYGSERDWDVSEFEKDFISVFLSKI